MKAFSDLQSENIYSYIRLYEIETTKKESSKMVKRFSYIETFDDHETFSIDATGSEHGIIIDTVQLPYDLKIRDISARLHRQTYLTEGEFTFLLFKIGMEVGKKVTVTNEVRKQIIKEAFEKFEKTGFHICNSEKCINQGYSDEFYSKYINASDQWDVTFKSILPEIIEHDANRQFFDPKEYRDLNIEDVQEGPFKVWVEKCPNEDMVVIKGIEGLTRDDLAPHLLCKKPYVLASHQIEGGSFKYNTLHIYEEYRNCCVSVGAKFFTSNFIPIMETIEEFNKQCRLHIEKMKTINLDKYTLKSEGK